MKVKRRWIILMAAMTLIALGGLAAGEGSFECDWSVISAADVAWLITATIFVLMMTPGLSFFYGGMVGAKNVISTMLQSFIAMGLISVLWEGFVVFLFHFIPMRVSEYSEKVGLDFSQHDEHYGLAHIAEREIAEYEEHIRYKHRIKE